MKKINKTLICAAAAAAGIAVAVPRAAYAAENDIAVVSETDTEISAEAENLTENLPQYVSQWYKDENGRFFYYDANGELLTGEQEIDGELYLFSNNGVLKTGWRTVGGKRRYYDPESGSPVYGWIDYCGKKYYVSESENGKLTCCICQNENGEYVLLGEKGDILNEKGMITLGGARYYIDENGVLQKGVVTIDGMPYVFGDDFAMKTGWADVDGRRYYYDPESGESVTGLIEIDGGRYYIDAEMGMLTGVVEINGTEYLFSEATGQMEYGWLSVNDDVRYFYSDGSYASGLTMINGTCYLFSNDGALLYGLNSLNGETYYSDKQGRACRGIVIIDEKMRYFGDDYTLSGGMAEYEGATYIFDDNGNMMTGRVEYNGDTYYLALNSGKMQTGKLLLNGKKYYFKPDGKMHRGWYTFDEGKYYFSQEGSAVTGINEIDGKKYFFNDEGIMTTGRLIIGGNKYYFGTDGAMAIGWVDLSDGRYYFGEDGIMYTGWHEIDGKRYYFNTSNGKLDPSKTQTIKAKFSAVRKNAGAVIAQAGENINNICEFVSGNKKSPSEKSSAALEESEIKNLAYFADYAIYNCYAVPAMLSAYAADAVSQVPVYDEFNKNDVNGTVIISVPSNAKASVFIGFTSPEVNNEPYYSVELSGGGTYSFDIEGIDNSADDYRFYDISVELTGGKYNITSEKFTERFAIPDGNDNPESYRKLTYNFTIDDEYSLTDMDIISENGDEKNIAAHLDYLLQGDVDNDGAITPLDASHTLHEYANLATSAPSEFNSRQRFTADVDMNSKIEPADASRILSYYAAIATSGSTDGIFAEPITVNEIENL